LERNRRSRLGEIDILMRDGETIVVVEVKTQRSAGIDPVFKIDARKRRKLWLLAEEVAAQYPGCNVRIDTVTVWWQGDEPRLRHYENSVTS
jgi:putative endonuclease